MCQSRDLGDVTVFLEVLEVGIKSGIIGGCHEESQLDQRRRSYNLIESSVEILALSRRERLRLLNSFFFQAEIEGFHVVESV